jgi:hypothetical protein
VSGSGISKIERVTARSNVQFGADLMLDKRSGEFFATVGGEVVRDKTKDGAVAKVQYLLAGVTQTSWRQVILLRVVEIEKSDYSSQENQLFVFSASCRFTYLRRERAVNPLKPKEQIEREHSEEFEERVAARRGREVQYVSGEARKRAKADEVERELRNRRAALADIQAPWSHFGDLEKEYEIPYSPEAWAGIQRISGAIREAQARLDAFARGATSESLARLLMPGGGVLNQLPAPPSNERRKKR